MKQGLTNADRILHAVLNDSKLIEYGEYDPKEYETLFDALQSDNPYVCTVAKIIDGGRADKTKKQIYNDIANYLFNNI